MSKIKLIAARMKEKARVSRTQHALPGGLVLTLLLDGEQHWRLSMTRVRVRPSAKEEEVVRRDFGVPVWADRETDTHGAGSGAWHIVRFRWPVVEQTSFEEWD